MGVIRHSPQVFRVEVLSSPPSATRALGSHGQLDYETLLCDQPPAADATTTHQTDERPFQRVG